MQEATAKPAQEQNIRLTAQTDVGYEYHLTMPESAVKDLIDPDVADAYIEVPVPNDVKNVRHRYVHTSRFKQIDVHDEFNDAPEVVGTSGLDALKNIKLGGN
jgi:outer membrane translocation and assembly module TamA